MKNVSLPLYLCTVIGTFKDKTVQIYKRARGEDTSENIAWNQEKTTTKKMKERFPDSGTDDPPLPIPDGYTMPLFQKALQTRYRHKVRIHNNNPHTDVPEKPSQLHLLHKGHTHWDKP